VDFLKEVCAFCLKTRVGQVYTTPWKSLLIKGINESDRKEWGSILNKYQVNVRHAANELNWQLENLCSESLELKKKLVREFEACDQRTYRLCFAIKMQPKTGLLASVVIKKQQPDCFNILHTRDFNPNSKDFVVFKSNVHRNKLGKYLIELCRIYYILLSDNNISRDSEKDETEDSGVAETAYMVHQCENCLSIYDEAYGDEYNAIPPGTDFETIGDYFCPVCESPKLNFLKVEKKVSGYQLS
jgi:rubredoxin